MWAKVPPGCDCDPLTLTMLRIVYVVQGSPQVVTVILPLRMQTILATLEISVFSARKLNHHFI